MPTTDDRRRRRCSEPKCKRLFNVARDAESHQQVDCMRCCGLTPSDVREQQRLRDPDRYERQPTRVCQDCKPRVFFLNEQHEI